MPEAAASFSFSFTTGTLEISGSELFVAQQVESFRDTILESLNAYSKPMAALPAPVYSASVVQENEAPITEEAIETASHNPFPRVLDTMGDRLKITTSIKGKGMADRAISLILAYLWGKERLLGEPTAEYKELRDLCEEHGCLDSGNFSSTLSSKRSLILVDGAKGSSSKVCKLTYPGREAAEAVLKQLNDGTS